GAQSVVAVPLVVRNAGIGELWIASPHNHAFDQADVQVVATAAGQLAGVLEQAFLAAQTDERLRRRVDQLSALTRLARQLSVPADLKSLLQLVYDEGLEITGAERGTIVLFDSDGVDAGIYTTRLYAGDPPASVLPEAEVRALTGGDPVCLAGEGGSLLMLAPIVYRQRPLGLIRLQTSSPDHFGEPTVETVSSLAAQAAVALGNAVQIEDQTRRSEQAQRELAAELQAYRQAGLSDLARTVQIQAEEIRRLKQQAEEMRAGLLIAERVAQRPDHQAALDTLAQEIMARFGLQVALTAESTPAGPRLLRVHGTLPAEVRPETLFGQRNPLRQALQEGQLCIVPDLDGDADWANCSLLAALGARSFVALPLKVTGQNRLGVLAVGQQPLSGYQASGEQVFSRLLRQVEISMQNMSLLGETRRRLSEVNRLLDFSRRLGSLNSHSILEALLEGVMNLVPGFQAGWVAVWDEENQLLRTQTAIGYPQSGHLHGLTYSVERSPAALPLHLVADGLPRRLDELDFAHSYPLPAEDLLSYRRATGGRLPVASLLLPIRLGRRVLGVLNLDNFDAVGAFSSVDEKLTLSLAQQTALALENSRLFEESRRLTEELEQRVQERTAELSRAHHNAQTMLQVVTELSASLDLDQVLVRALGVLNESTGAEQSLIVLASGDRVYPVGMPLAAAKPAGELSPERELARQVMRQRAPLLSGDLARDEQLAIVDRERLPYASLLGVPLVLGEDVLGALLLVHRQAGSFRPDQIGLVEATTRQIAITLNNAELFVLIRDQSERLGAMLREQQIHASRSLAILEAIADGVVVTDKDNLITLFNASAERILDLDTHQVLRRRLDEFGGLFGPQTRAWMDVIRTWADRPDELYRGESYAEQMTLDNGRVVSVHLAPAVWRHEFLGTVSVFRDITHEAQVDRLKSEFVANVSHELRTPLTSIKGYVELVLKGVTGPLTDQQAHFLQIVQENTARLNVLVNDLLDISKIETGKVSLVVEPLDLAGIAAEVVAEIRRRAQDENRPLRVELDLPAQLPPVPGDYGRVRQVFANLMANAYNYTPPDGLICLQLCAKNGAVQVDIHDNGIGIAPEARERIFERFYRGEDPLVLATAGTGLGL
ncbi:MAG TPA: GAF domain-containing protein, partial [Anaerolineaceae bacterium]|nr:GAF domain-containing protein [Anaerolineaceae bacterium]